MPFLIIIIHFIHRRIKQNIAPCLLKQVNICSYRPGVLLKIFWVIKLGGVNKNAAYPLGGVLLRLFNYGYMSLGQSTKSWNKAGYFFAFVADVCCGFFF